MNKVVEVMKLAMVIFNIATGEREGGGHVEFLSTAEFFEKGLHHLSASAVEDGRLGSDHLWRRLLHRLSGHIAETFPALGARLAYGSGIAAVEKEEAHPLLTA